MKKIKAYEKEVKYDECGSTNTKLKGWGNVDYKGLELYYIYVGLELYYCDDCGKETSKVNKIYIKRN